MLPLYQGFYIMGSDLLLFKVKIKWIGIPFSDNFEFWMLGKENIDELQIRDILDLSNGHHR